MKSTLRPNLSLRENTAEFLVQTRGAAIEASPSQLLPVVYPVPALHHGIGLPDREVRRCRAQENGERVASSHPNQRIYFRGGREGLGDLWDYHLREIPHPRHEGQHPPFAASAGDVLSHPLMPALPIDGFILYSTSVGYMLYCIAHWI